MNNVEICRVIIFIFILSFFFFFFFFVVVVLIHWGTPSHFSIKAPDLSLPTKNTRVMSLHNITDCSAVLCKIKRALFPPSIEADPPYHVQRFFCCADTGT